MRLTRLAIIALTAILLGIAGVASLRPAPVTAQGAPQAAYSIYVPLVRVAGQAPSPPPPAGAGPALLLLSRDIKTNSAASAVGPDGTRHVAGAAYVPYGQASPAIYARCPAGGACDTLAGWSVVQLGDKVDELQLGLTPDGRPRLLMLTNEHHYLYAACDAGCDSPAGWGIVDLVNSEHNDVNQFANPQRSFALDAQGRPRFVYFAEFAPRGAYYAWCDDGCLDANNWWQVRISHYDEYNYDLIDYPSLALTADGRPRVLAEIFSYQGSPDPSGVYYLECDANCGDEASWGRAYLLDRGQGPDASWDLEVDASGRAHIAVYEEELPDGGGHQLIYASCAAGCLDAASWNGGPIGLPAGAGAHPDLALDSAGRPRLAYRVSGDSAIGYAWCDGGCAAAAGWRHTAIDPLSGLDAEFPVTAPTSCPSAGWMGGYRPSLSIDAAGDPQLAYDVLYGAKCLSSDPYTGKIYSRVETLWLAVRWAILSQP